MKFGKQILSEQVPGWSPYYLDYKFLKKIISSLAAKRPGAEAAALALGMRPADILSPTPSGSNVKTSLAGHPNIWESSLMTADPELPPLSTSVHGEDTSLDFQAHKAAFFFKLERELERINGFYLQKEAELKLRLETLLSKRRAAALRTLPEATDNLAADHVEWTAVEEGFRLLERDLAKLLQFIELNATGFRKILKKWDKRSKSQTKELYLAREVEVQPVFNRQLIAELADTVAACLLDLTDLSRGLKYENPAANDLILTRQLSLDQSWSMRPFHDLESSLRRAVQRADLTTVEEVIRHSDVLAQQPGGRTNVTRILWKAVIDSPPAFADLILSIASNLFDFKFVDDINGRTCLHQAAMVGILRLVNVCLDNNVPSDKVDAYGRSALHYAAMNGHADVCRRLLKAGVRVDRVDMDNITPLVHATLKGSLECVRVLVDEAASPANPPFVNADLSPLSLASRAGHLNVVTFLIEAGAENKPNSNGQYPIHLSAKEGHVEVCRFLIRRDGWDLPDKYHEWTPLFHAARYGHAKCLRLFLEAGAQVCTVDEFGQSPIHYAAWNGHNDCVALLLESSQSEGLSAYQTPKSDFSPAAPQEDSSTEEEDTIPSLILPPPIMPYRFYGHNYLDKNCLVQITIGDKMPCRSVTGSEPVKLYPSFMTVGYQENYLNSSPLFKIVITAIPDTASGPFSIPLPLRDQPLSFAFQAPSIETLRLDFSLYPNFGTKTIGRAIALPPLFKKAERNRYVLPILDHKLHLIGEVTFGLDIITPFSGVTLEVGGAVETYWKSTTVAKANVPRPWSVSSRQQSSPESPHRPLSSQSAAAKNHSLTVSSIIGDYVYVVVQLTQDAQPVAYPFWKLQEDKFDLYVPDLTLAQFEKLAIELGRNVDPQKQKPTTSAQWYSVLRRSMLSLAELLSIVPSNIGLCLEVACLPRLPDRSPPNINASIDSVLRTIYQRRPDNSGNSSRRRIVFTSFSPGTCAALNWKQPNYPVFFASLCGKESSSNPGPTVLAHAEAGDERLSSLRSAVRFSKANNFLGVIVDGDILVKVPSLVQAVKDAGLLVLTWGTAEVLASLTSACEGYDGTLDATLHDGVLTFWEHAKSRLG